MISNFLSRAVVIGAVVLPVGLVACSSDNPLTGAQDGLCCTEFKAGAQIDAKIGGSAESLVAVQAVADISGIASAAIDDITTACRSMATDLDVPQADRDAAEAMTDKNAKMTAFCKLASSAVVTAKASAKATITVSPPGCSASVSAKASCQGGCTGGAKCDIKANPPMCTGGKLEVSCKGGCTASGSAPSVSCEGSCEGGCTGSCTAEGGVKCMGKCEGTCEGNTMNGSAMGTCEGMCKGTCSATPPEVKCEGSCGGSCKGSCKATPGNVAVKCDGMCDGDFEPLKCEGGELTGGCKVDVKCEANCDASVKAKAECHPGSIDFKFTGDAEIAGKLKATLNANFGVISTFSARLEALVKVSGGFTTNVGAVADIKLACIPAVVAAAATAVANVKGAADATVMIAGSVTSG